MLQARTLPVRPVGTAVLCVLATAVSPLGFSLWAEVPASLTRLRLYGVTEWQPASASDLWLAPYWLLLIGLIGLVFAERPWRWSADTPRVLVFAALALLPVSLTASRNVPPFLLPAIPAVGVLLNERFPAGPARVRRERPLVHAAALTVAVLGAVAVVGHAWASQAARLQWRPMSEAAIAAVADCPAPMYNSYDNGGYLIWFVPQHKVFLDSRQDPYPPELVNEHIRLETTGEYLDTFERYAIGCAFVPAESRLARRLTDAKWRRTYADETWAVFRE